MTRNYLFIIIIFLSSCKRKDETKSTISYQTRIPVSYQIYCWSFFSCDSTMSPFSLTSTQISVGASTITKVPYLIISDSNNIRALRLYDLFLKDNDYSQTTTTKLYTDTANDDKKKSFLESKKQVASPH